MAHSNISIFVPHIGCSNCCSFCNQHSITGKAHFIPRADDVRALCSSALERILNPQNTEIAFFGGSFTAIERGYMQELLSTAFEFVGENKFLGIRISTRPDCISEEILTLLKSFGVTTIELGAQSMSDNVLSANDRGHTADDVRNASALIKSFGFKLGLQMMVGLYKSTVKLDSFTADELIKLSPDEVRIYPTVILGGTRLAELYANGEYKPYSLEVAVKLCSELLERFEQANIRVIKLGLHASEAVESELVGGLYHPAFRELCEGEIFLRKIVSTMSVKANNFTVYVPKGKLSQAIGQKRCNIKKLANMQIFVKIKEDNSLNGYEIRIEEEKACT